VEELAYVEEINQELRRQVESCPTRGGFSPASPLQWVSRNLFPKEAAIHLAGIP
jgi:hypothetical protein